MIDILSLNLDELKQELAQFGEPAYRAKQIYEWLHIRKISDFDEITNISKQLREKLREKFCIKSLNMQKRLVSSIDDTVKYLYMLDDGNCIETVFMSHNHGNSLCISSQVGCRMGCRFCMSAQCGFVRNLTPSEMLLQIYRAEKEINSVVVMGIGEPLDNFDNVKKFLEILPMSLRHVSLSTCGLADEIDELAKLKLGLTLSISLHATNDKDRTAIMPINARYNLERLLSSCANYFTITRRRISYEYALIDGVNDTEENAYELAKLLKKLPKGSYHVNIIPINPVGANCVRPPDTKQIKTFSTVLERENINVTVRRTLGADINAACGQLRRGELCSPDKKEL
ncbi:MAG: 23S rRNA (adenine(2503)-C(2))-methyltransferase RlmN [Oscillospiraceae bacterium]|nr:23S rRNA (adenine(2503)-C(2))-methyltransferase RlmN [Oscillospiraceae bacterium]